MYIILISLLLLGHVLSDFYFQNDVISKQKKDFKRVLILHGIIYFFVTLSLTLPFFSIKILSRLLILNITHIAIDYLKIIYQNKQCRLFKTILMFLFTKMKVPYNDEDSMRRSDILSFLTDQCLHILCIFIIFPTVTSLDFNNLFYKVLSELSINYPIFIGLSNTQTAYFILMSAFILFIINGGTIISRLVLDPYLDAKQDNSSENIDFTTKDTLQTDPTTDKHVESNETNNVKAKIDMKAGKIIGVLERLLIFSLIISNNYTVIAIVIAAKTAVRFKNLENQRFSEYYLIGTLSSVIVALLMGGIWKFLIPYI